MAVPAMKNERIDLRTNEKEKVLLERAAEIKHVSLSSYVISTSLHQAEIDIAEQENLFLPDADRDALLAALETPPEPNEALKDLFR